MGYWSTHPMGGDTPWDLKADLLNDREDYFEEEYGIEWASEEMDKKMLEWITDNFLSLLEQAERTNNFTLPWICMEYEVKVPKIYIERVKALIGDGGSSDRGYPEGIKDSPATYAKMLYDNFEEYLENHEKYLEDLRCESLMEAAVDMLANKESGLVNVN